MIATFVLALCALVNDPAQSSQPTQAAASRVFLGGHTTSKGFAFSANAAVAREAQSGDDPSVRIPLYTATSEALAPSVVGDLEFKWEAAKMFLEGGSLDVHVEITATKDGADAPSWMLQPAAFAINGKPLGDRSGPGHLKLGPNGKISVDLDIGPDIASLKDMEHKSFKLTYGNENNGTLPIDVTYMQPVEKGLDFLKMSKDDLAKYHVVLQTNRGDMECEFWPDLAPATVANFIDLAYTGFYNGTTFHRVIPGFMIQGGDPSGTGGGKGPRTLKAEFNGKQHVPGVLSMAREGEPDSASCQFFIVQGKSPHLDGLYTAFGKLVSGLEVVDKIANMKKDALDKPLQPQTILKAIVVRVSSK